MKINKPIYFNVVVWGEEHTGYLLNYCIPSLLAPNNIPKLVLGKQNKFILCTTKEDWIRIQNSEIYALFIQYIEVVFKEIPPPPPDKSGCQYMAVGHKIATDMMWQDKVYGSILTPDQVFADGCIEFLQETVKKGYDAVLTPACLRTRSDQLFAAFQKETFRQRGHHDPALVISKRSLVKIIRQSIHDASLIYEWGQEYFVDFPVGTYISLYEGSEFKGFVYYILSWAISLVDYGIIKTHDTSMLHETATIDASYFHNNFGKQKNIYFVTTSDEFISTSWSAADEYPVPMVPCYRGKPKWFATTDRLAKLCLAYRSSAFDAFKRTHFSKTIIYNCQEVDDEFKKIARHSKWIILVTKSRIFYIVVFTYKVIKTCWHHRRTQLFFVRLRQYKCLFRHLLKRMWMSLMCGMNKVLIPGIKLCWGDADSKRRLRNFIRRIKGDVDNQEIG